MSCPYCKEPLDFIFDDVDEYTKTSCKVELVAHCYKCDKVFDISKKITRKDLIERVGLDIVTDDKDTDE